MQNTEVFEKFLDSKYGRRILEEFNKEKRFIENPADLIVKKINNKTNIDDYLDVGGGTGVRTLKIMKGLGITHIDFLEPAKKAPLDFCKKVPKLGLDVNIIRSRFEDFKPVKKYDLITSVHTWYYIDLNSLERLYDLLKAGGVACIFMDSEKDTIKKIQEICESNFLKYKTNNAEDVCRQLDKLRIKYTVHKDEKTFSGLLKNGKYTKRAKIMMSLVSYAKWSDIPKETKISVKKMLQGISKKDRYPSRRWLIVIRNN